MWTSLRNKLLFTLGLLAFLGSSKPELMAAGPITVISITFDSDKIFTAGVTTNTPTTTVFINTFAAGSTDPSALEVVTLELLDNGTVVNGGMSPTSFTTTGSGLINGGNLSLPITFFRAGTSLQMRATSATLGATNTSSTLTVLTSSATKLVILGPGMTHVPGTNPQTTNGTSGSFTTQEPLQAFPITVILTDNQFNKVSSNDTVSFASGDFVQLPSPGALVNGTRDFNVTLTGARITRTITVSDTTPNTGVSSGSLDVTTAGPAAKEIFPFPSPFNPTTGNITFRFRVSEAKDVKLIVTDLFGQRVWEKSVAAPVGFTDVTWNGRNENGTIVAVGVYYVLLEVGGSLESKKRFGVVK